MTLLPSTNRVSQYVTCLGKIRPTARPYHQSSKPRNARSAKQRWESTTSCPNQFCSTAVLAFNALHLLPRTFGGIRGARVSTDKPLDPTRGRLLVRQEEMKLIDPTAGPAIPGVDSPREFTTAQRAVAKLEELSIITEISRAKGDR